MRPGRENALERGLPVEKAHRLRDIQGRRLNACRRVLPLDPSPRVVLVMVQVITPGRGGSQARSDGP